MGKFRQHQSGTLAIAILLALSLSGCESTGNWLKGRKTAEPEPVSADAPSSDIYLAELSKLVNSDPAAQTEIFLDAKDRAELTPSPGTRLLYALLLATPGHAETDPLLAQVILRDLLTKAEVMTPNEASLASIHLRDVEERLVLESEVSTLRAQNSMAANTEERAVAQRVASVEAENRRLQQALAEAEDKLEAITSIERDIRDQPEVEQR